MPENKPQPEPRAPLAPAPVPRQMPGPSAVPHVSPTGVLPPEPIRTRRHALADRVGALLDGAVARLRPTHR